MLVLSHFHPITEIFSAHRSWEIRPWCRWSSRRAGTGRDWKWRVPGARTPWPWLFFIWEVARSSVGENPENLKSQAFSCLFCFDHYDSWWFHDVSWLLMAFVLSTKLETKHKDTRIPTSCGPVFSVPWIGGRVAVAAVAPLHPISPRQLRAAVQLRIHQQPTLRSSEIGGSHHHSTFMGPQWTT